MGDVLFQRLNEILREVDEGGLPGEGTEYLYRGHSQLLHHIYRDP